MKKAYVITSTKQHLGKVLFTLKKHVHQYKFKSTVLIIIICGQWDYGWLLTFIFYINLLQLHFLMLTAKIIYRNKIIFYQVAYYQKTCILPPPPTTFISFTSKNLLWGTLPFYGKKPILQNTVLKYLKQLTKIYRRHNYSSRASNDIFLLQIRNLCFNKLEQVLNI